MIGSAVVLTAALLLVTWSSVFPDHPALFPPEAALTLLAGVLAFCWFDILALVIAFVVAVWATLRGR
jgi:hypothetical protein